MTRVVSARPAASSAAQRLADVLVEEAAQAEISGLRPFHHVRCFEEFIISKGFAVVLEIGMQRFVPALVELGQWQFLVIVAIEMLRRGGQRKMRAHEGQKHDPRSVRVLARFLAQPDLSARGDLAVVGRVHALAGACHPRHLVRAASLWHVLVTHEAQQISFAVDDVHSDLLVGEAVVVVLAAEVELADRNHMVTAIAQQVMPARHAAVVGHGVVPGADLVHVLAGGERRPRGNAHWAGRVGAFEQRAALRQPVEIGRRNDRVAVAAEHSAVVLIRHDDQQVGWSDGWALRSGGASILYGGRACTREVARRGSGPRQAPLNQSIVIFRSFTSRAYFA